ncbi:MAG: NADH-quinone oxidoreductase subunit C [Sphingomonadales bacterium]|nr:NADH-quinone oxidoreductase subunit C [Sphingomonadales bacterium]
MASPAPRMASNEGVIDAVRSALGDVVLSAEEAVDEISVTVERDALNHVMRTLRDTPGLDYQQMMEIAGVDYPGRPERFEVVYHLLSLTRNHRIRIRVSTDEETPVPTITDIWPNAGWLEREVFDMYGVLFEGNKDLRRILTDYGFRGHPQRKDFPLTGYVELRYSEEHKRVVYEPVELPQDFRTFDFMSPWEGAEYILPGDEKAGEEEGAPTPVDADEMAEDQDKEPVGEDAEPTPKTTDSPAETGAGPVADAKAADTEHSGEEIDEDAAGEKKG